MKEVKVLTKESIEEFKRLKIWVRKCPIEAAQEIESLREDNVNWLKYVNDLREALRFYANEENYNKEGFKPLNPKAKVIMMSTVEWDGGDKARETLAPRK